MRYEFFLGTTNTGLTPTFDRYVNAATGAAVAQPAIVEATDGVYYFVEPWADPSITSISYVVSGGGIEAHDVISATTLAAGVGVGSVGAAIPPGLWTVGNILNTVAVEIGIDEVADPFASQSGHFKQMRALLRTCGKELVKVKEWPALVKEVSFTGTGTDTLFSLPADFDRFVNHSGWRRADTTPLHPVTSSEWQWLKAWSATQEFEVQYRLGGGRMQFHKAPALAAVLYSDYVSFNWVASSGSSVADSSQPASSDDTVMLDPLMVMRLLKFKFLDAKGMPGAAGAYEEFLVAREAALGAAPAPVLSLNGRGSTMHLVDNGNYPVTGWGA